MLFQRKEGKMQFGCITEAMSNHTGGGGGGGVVIGGQPNPRGGGGGMAALDFSPITKQQHFHLRLKGLIVNSKISMSWW